MKKYKRIKQLLSLSTAVCVALAGAGSLSGCGSKAGDGQEAGGTDSQETGQSKDAKAMGRYLEEELSVPENCMMLSDFTILEDGTFQMVARNENGYACLYKSSDQGKTWDEGTPLSQIMGLESGEEDPVYTAALGKDGSILVGNYIYGTDDSSPGTMEYYYCKKDDTVTKLDLGAITGETFAFTMKIGNNGNLFLMLTGNGIVEINPEDQTLVHEYEKGKHTDFMGVTSKYLIVVANGDVLYYDISTGKPAEGGEALTSQLKKTPANLEMGNSTGYPILFMDGDEEDSLFFVDSSGLYRYAFGGNLIEQFIDGNLTSLSGNNKAFATMTKDADGRFYIGTNNYENMAGELFSYTYSADTPTVPDTELTIYSLEENSSIRQAVVMFQKKYPDIYLTLETGMTGEDGVTRTDALKILNTEIMAGKGPDILIMDGMSSETYIKQGMLENLSDTLKDAGLLSNIQDAYTREDGSIYEMPVKFGIPMIEGSKADVDQVTDLTSLADVTEAHKDEYGPSEETFYKFPFVYSLYSQPLLEKLADSSSAAWLKADGTLDEEKVKDFLEQAGRIYQAGKDGVDEIKAAYPQAFEDGQQPSYDRSYGIAGDAIGLLSEMNLFAVGGVFSPYDFATVVSMTKQREDLTYKLWNGQAENCFIPVNKIGVNAKSSQKEGALKFVEYLFSEEGQQILKNDGFPVVESVYDNDSYWDQGEVGKVLSSVGSSNSVSGQEILYDITVPEEEKVTELKNLGKTLTIPILDNAIIAGAVDEAGVCYLNGEIGLEEAVNSVIQEVNLYLAE